MISEETKTVADEYIDKFLESKLSLVKITDNNYSLMALREALLARIKERGLNEIIAYTFLKGLYLEKV